MRDVPQAQNETYHSTASRTRVLSACAGFYREPGHSKTAGTEPGARALHAIVSGKGELAFLCDPLERFARTLDAILAVVPFGRQQADHLVGAGGSRTRHVARSEIDSRSNRELVLQRPLHTRIFRPDAHGPRDDGRFENPAAT